MSKPNAKTKRADAERACEWYAREILGCVQTRRAVRTKWQKVDFFGADVMGKCENGSTVYIQATAGQDAAVSTRRRKLEIIPWHYTETVEVVRLIQTIDPANARRKLWFFRVHVYSIALGGYNNRGWITQSAAIPIPPHWFKKWKGEDSHA